MDQLFITLTTGIANGAVYGLIGLGLVIIFRSTDVMNFAMASLSTLAIYVALSAYGAGVGIVVALVVAVVFGALSGVVVREALIRPLGQGKLFAALVVTMGLSIIVEHLIGQYWGEQPRRFPQLIDGTISIGNSNLMLQDIATIVLAALAVSAIAYLFTRTRSDLRCARSPNLPRPPRSWASTRTRSRGPPGLSAWRWRCWESSCTPRKPGCRR